MIALVLNEILFTNLIYSHLIILFLNSDNYKHSQKTFNIWNKKELTILMGYFQFHTFLLLLHDSLSIYDLIQF